MLAVWCKALSPTTAPLFTATRLTGARLAVSQDGRLRLGDLLQDSQDPAPGLPAQDAASNVLPRSRFQSWHLCPKLGAGLLAPPPPGPSLTVGRGGPPPSPGDGPPLLPVDSGRRGGLRGQTALAVTLVQTCHFGQLLKLRVGASREVGDWTDGPSQPRALGNGHLTYQDVSEVAVRARAAARA